MKDPMLPMIFYSLNNRIMSKSRKRRGTGRRYTGSEVNMSAM